MLYIDLKYLHFLTPKLDGFVRKKDNVFNFRCPFCLDSKINKRKMRGYIYAWKNDLRYRCHNCGVSYSFHTLLKMLDPFLHQQYRLEIFKESSGATTKHVKREDMAAPSFDHESKFQTIETNNEIIFHEICQSLDKLPSDNAAVKYCTDRLIPKSMFERLYYIKDTKDLIRLVPELNIPFSEERLVLPFLDKNGKLIGMTCRALKKTNLRYLTVKLSDVTQVFGLDKVDPTETIYIVEGPIDSLFLPNAIAVTGTAFGKVDSVLKELNIAPDQVVLIIDNQPRNVEVVKIQSRLIDAGFNVVVWDINDSQGKDINALIQESNISMQQVLNIIKRCTTRGLEAKMKFIQWKKC